VKPLFEGTRVLVGLASKHLGERQLPHGSGFSEDKNNHNAINGLFGNTLQNEGILYYYSNIIA
jgi:hypothetical protein